VIAEVGVSELALKDDQRDTLARHLDGVGVAELVRRESPPDVGERRRVAQLFARGGRRPAAAARRSGQNAEQLTDGQRDAVRRWVDRRPLLRGGRPEWKPGIVAGDRRRPAASSSTFGMTRS
jgi:hypothetical protein